ncbi:MAG: hypothetical protein HYX40_07180 [Sphingobacteriales bacterium]|nr:hypothetical protein [Sphingobacteriales bacterium]
MPTRSLLIAFGLITLFIFLFRTPLTERGLDTMVLYAGNFIMFVVTLVSAWFHYKGAASKNPNAFVRSVYGGNMIKLFSVMIAVMVYVLTIHSVSKFSIIACLLFYVIYTVIEVRAAMKTIKGSGK